MAELCKYIQLLHDNDKIYGKPLENGKYDKNHKGYSYSKCNDIVKFKTPLTKYMLCIFDAYLLRTSTIDIDIDENSTTLEKQYMLFKLLHASCDKSCDKSCDTNNKYSGLVNIICQWFEKQHCIITNPFLLSEIHVIYSENIKFIYNSIKNKGMCLLYRKIYLKNDLIIKNYKGDKHLLRHEYELYIKMSKISNNFCSFNKVNYSKEILTGIYDPRLITFQHMFNYDYKCIIPLLNVMNSVMKKNHFFHGDLKENNVLIDPYTYNIQIIDLEHSRIVDKHTFFTDNDICIDLHNYDYDNPDKTDNVIIYIDERYLYFYDMFKLVTTIYKENILNDLNELFKYSKTQTHLDFLVIYNVYHNYKGEDKYNYKAYLYITPSKLVNKIMMTDVVMEERLMEHHEMIKNMIKKNF